jgi:hypothetical protein
MPLSVAARAGAENVAANKNKTTIASVDINTLLRFI